MRRKIALALTAIAVAAGLLWVMSPATQAAPAARAAQTVAAAPVMPVKIVLDDAAVVAAAVAAAVATYYNNRCGNTSGRVLISVDDWAYGDPYRAVRIGAYLKSLNIRAVFFLINKYAKQYPDIVRTLRLQGHWVLNHTLNHITNPAFANLSDSTVRYEIANGIASNRLRPPGGSYDTQVSRIATSLGYRICTWTIDTRDWQYVSGARRSVASIRYIVRTSSASAKSSGVILGHLFTNFEQALPGIIYDLHRQGYLFCRNRGPVGANMPFPATCT